MSSNGAATPIDAVIFDCDGVLVESETIAARVWVEMANELGYPLPYETAVREFKGGEMAWCVAWLERKMNTSVPTGFVPDFRARSAVRFKTELNPVPGIYAVLEGLEIPFCVASNGPRDKMAVSLLVTGLAHLFEGRIVSAYEVGVFKPAPDLFLEAARVLGVAPQSCAVVEDSLPGIRAGVAAQMRVFAYSAPEDFAAHREEGATPFGAMSELPDLLGAA